MTRRISAVYMLFLGLVLVGCTRGCTTMSTLDSESKTVIRKGEEVVITAKTIDYRHSKRNGYNLLDRKISHTYGMSYSLHLFGNSFGEVYNEGVDNPDLVNLNDELKRVEVRLSKNKKHLGVGVDDMVVEIIHIYKEHPIHVQSSRDSIEGNLKWADLNLESLPDPETIILDEIRTNCGFFNFDQGIAMSVLDDYPSHDTIHRMLLSNWPNCTFAKKYLDDKRTKKFLKNRTWKKYATERGIEVIRENGTSPWEVEEVHRFLNRLNSQKINELIDSSYVANWGNKMNSSVVDGLIKRLKSKKNPMSPATRDLVIRDAKTSFEKYMRSGSSDHTKDATSCMKILLATGDTETADKFLVDGFVDSKNKYNLFDFTEVVFDNFDEYTTAQQKYILEKIPELFENCKNYFRSTIFRESKEHVSCLQLKEWLKDYPDDLRSNSLPKSCSGGRKVR